MLEPNDIDEVQSGNEFNNSLEITSKPNARRQRGAFVDTPNKRDRDANMGSISNLANSIQNLFSSKSTSEVEVGSVGWGKDKQKVSDIGERKTTVISSANGGSENDVIEMIPDIQDLNGGDASQDEVATAPQFQIAPIRTIGELERDIAEASNQSLNQVRPFPNMIS